MRDRCARYVVGLLAVAVIASGLGLGRASPAVAAPEPPLTDCDRVFYLNWSNLEVWSVATDGADQRKELDATSQFVLSPDGRKIAYIQSARVWVANRDGSDPRHLSAGFDAGGGPLAWSPDGTRLAWPRIVRSSWPYQGDIVVADVETGSRTHITDLMDYSRIVYTRPVWSPDGSQLAYLYSDADGTDVRTVRSTGGGETSVGPFTGPSFLGPLGVYWSLDGTTLYYFSAEVVYPAAGVYIPTLLQLAPGGVPVDLLGLAEPVGTTPEGDVLVIYGGDHSKYFAFDPETRQLRVETPAHVGVRLPGRSRHTTQPVSFAADGRTAVFAAHQDIYRYVRGTDTIEKFVDGAGDTLVSPKIVPCPPFFDVSSASFAIDDVALLFRAGVTTGSSSTTYSPGDSVTREEMAAFLARLWRALGNVCPSGLVPFTDVGGSFAADDIACIYFLGVTAGSSSPTTYSPGDSVTREEMAAFLARLWRALGNVCPSGVVPFTDVGGSFAADDIACIYFLGVTAGSSSTTYSPGDSVTREEMAAFLARLWRLA